MPKSNVIGLPSLLKRLERFGKDAEKGIDQITEAVVSEVMLDARQRAPKNFGKLQQSIVYNKVGKLTYRVTVGKDYGAYVEFGTGPKVQVPAEFQNMASKFKGGGSGTFEEALQSIKDWCRAKGIPENAAYPILMSLLKNGMRPQPYLYPAYVKGRVQYLQDLKQLLKELTK